jgi:hypothetical protein
VDVGTSTLPGYRVKFIFEDKDTMTNKEKQYLTLGIFLMVIADIFTLLEKYSKAFPFFLGIFVLLFLIIIPFSGYCLVKWANSTSKRMLWVIVSICANSILCYAMISGQEPGLWDIWTRSALYLWIITGFCSIIGFSIVSINKKKPGR